MTARQTLGGLALPLVIGLLAFSGTAPAKEHWATCLNPRFGATADYPADLFTVKDAPPENGDGQSFHTADGRAELAIYGGSTSMASGRRPTSHITLTSATSPIRRSVPILRGVRNPRCELLFRPLRLLPSPGEGQVGPKLLRRAPSSRYGKALCPPGAALALKARQFQC